MVWRARESAPLDINTPTALQAPFCCGDSRWTPFRALPHRGMPSLPRHSLPRQETLHAHLMITKRTGEALDPTFLCRDQSMRLPDDRPRDLNIVGTPDWDVHAALVLGVDEELAL